MLLSLPASWHVAHLKLVGYLLNPDHAIGGPKARLFLSYGFAPDAPERLAEALFDHADMVPFRFLQADKSIRLVCEGALRSSRGIMPRIRSVWMLEPDESSARLLTAYPYDER